MRKIAWWLGVFAILCIGGAFAVYRAGSPVIFPTDDRYNDELISTGSGVDSTNRVVSSDVPKKYVSLVIVRDEVRSQYDGNTWTRNIGFTENDDLQIFNVVIWGGGDKIASKKISVYKFDRMFDPNKADYIQGGQSWVDYRERYNILNVDVPSSSSSEYLVAFQRVMETVIASQPALHYGIKYLGHGRANSSMFAGKIDSSDSVRLLTSVDTMIGKKIDFLDWDTNCGGGTYDLVNGQYRFADYILASDLNRGGYTFGQPDPGVSAVDFADALQFQEPTAKLDIFFSPEKTIRQSLIDMVNSQRVLWEKALKNNMVTNKIKQSISIYDSSQFEELVASTNLDRDIQKGDVLLYIRTNDPFQERKFYNFRFSYVSNKDFFTWDEDSNGFKR